MQAVAWLSCFPKMLLYYPITFRRLVVMAVWAVMACLHMCFAEALRRESRCALTSSE